MMQRGGVVSYAPVSTCDSDTGRSEVGQVQNAGAS